MNTSLAAAPPTVDRLGELSSFCEELFSSLSRSDQRKWAEIYVRGLLSVPGRKSIRRISDHVVGAPVDQCLQQFVNQSPWQWEPVRRALAHRAAAIRPRAWVVEDVVFPKHGDNSVGVARQYAVPAKRTLNCQLGLAIFLANEDARCAVNWRLMLPKCWDDDPARRTRTRLPGRERHRPRWRHLLDAVDEMSFDWGLGPVPVVLDAGDQWAAPPLVRGLVERGLPYVLRVPEHTPVRLKTPESGSGHVLAAGELAAYSARRGQTTRRTAGSDGRLIGTQYSRVSLRNAYLPAERAQATSAGPSGGTRQVLAEWFPGGRGLKAVWLTNLTAARLPELVRLVTLGLRTRREGMASLRNNFGLQHFEGRSFAGWHHHVTLVSAAHAHWTLRQSRERRGFLRPSSARSLT